MSKRSHEIGSGNVFKDLGIPNAEEHLVKAQLVFKIDCRPSGCQAARCFEDAAG
jgi:hypothetical protein